MFEKKIAPKESYEEASKEQHTCECPKCGYQGTEKEFVKPEFFDESKQDKNAPKGHHVLTITMGSMKGMPADDSEEQ